VKAALLTGYQQDYIVDTVSDPEGPGPMEVIVRVGAAGVCRTDVHMWLGEYEETHASRGIGLPFIGGHETAGWIAEVGAGVTHVKIGDAVLLHPLATCGFCLACRAGDDMHCSSSTFPGIFVPGGFAEYVKTSARSVVPLPEGITPIDVAPLGCAGITAYRAVRKALPFAAPGTRTVVLGAGGLGHIGIQALRALSQTEIIVVDRNESALDLARDWGADHTVLAREDRSHVQAVKELTGGVGAEVVIDFIGEGGMENDGLELVGTNGVDILVGFGGKIVVENILEQVLFPEKKIIGILCGNYVELVELVALVQRGAVKLAATTLPLEGINDALRSLADGRMTGRAVLIPNSN
jgi:NAD+-dependent secondary alcohol dehydrogenase Adh1